MGTNSKSTEKRVVVDRRRRKLPPLKYLLFGGKRKEIRRNEDKKELGLVDHYNPKFLIMTVSILVLSLADGFFTLYLMDYGAYELNPVMDYLIKLSP